MGHMEKMHAKPKVSVIIPCYKQAVFLPQAIDSVLAQTHDDLECIVVNDGSPDNTREVVASYLLRDSRVRYVEQSNQGLSAARNRGLAEAKGRYIQFLDSDDLLAPEKLQLQLKALETCHEIAFSYCDFYYCDEIDTTKKVLKGLYPSPEFRMARPLHDMALRWEDDFSMPPHCFLFDGRFFTDHKIRFDENLPNHEDWDCWMRILALNPCIVRVATELAIYRVHGASMSRQDGKMGKGFLLALRKQKKQLKGDHEVVKLLNLQILKTKKKCRDHSSIVTAWRQVNLTISRLYERTIPWPIQKMLSRFFKIGN